MFATTLSYDFESTKKKKLALELARLAKSNRPIANLAFVPVPCGWRLLASS